jgi:hypothetical protein
MAANAPGHKIDRQPDHQRTSGPDQPAQGDEFRWCVVAGTLLLGLTILTLSLNGGSLNLTPNSLALNVNPRR